LVVAKALFTDSPHTARADWQEALQGTLIMAALERTAINDLLDWAGVAGGFRLEQRIALLCVEYVSRTGQMPLDEAEARASEILNGASS
jgi:hypothetical protein